MASERLDREFRHVLRRCPKLSDAQVRLLAVVSSYSQGCHLTYDEICNLANWSRSKLSRTIRSLEKLRLIEVKYRSYKRTTIKIAPASRQLEFASSSHVSHVTHESCSTHEIDTGHPWDCDVSPTTQPILEKELERNIETGDFANANNGKIDVQRLIAEAFPSLGRKISRSS